MNFCGGVQTRFRRESARLQKLKIKLALVREIIKQVCVIIPSFEPQAAGDWLDNF